MSNDACTFRQDICQLQTSLVVPEGRVHFIPCLGVYKRANNFANRYRKWWWFLFGKNKFNIIDRRSNSISSHFFFSQRTLGHIWKSALVNTNLIKSFGKFRSRFGIYYLLGYFDYYFFFLFWIIHFFKLF